MDKKFFYRVPLCGTKMKMKQGFIALGIFVILLVAGFFSYKTLLNYEDLIKKSQITDQSLPTYSSSSIQDLKKGDEQKITNELEANPEPRTIMPKALDGKFIAMIIAFKDFRDEEYFIVKRTLEAAGAKVFTASVALGTARGADGGEVPINLLVKDIKVQDYDAVVFIGGPGALRDLDNENSYSIVRQTISDRKLLAAICVSPVILAEAGGLRGKNATVWSSQMDKSAVNILKDNGAIYQEKSVVTDGNIITGNCPASSEEFAMKIIEMLP